MKKKIAFILSIVALCTPFIVGIITMVTEIITQSDTEYIANFIGGAMLGSAISLVFSITSIILCKKKTESDISGTVLIDVMMLFIGIPMAVVVLQTFLTH